VLLEYGRKLSAAAHVAAGICILLWGGRNCTFNSCLRYVRYTRHGRRTSISDLQRVAEWALFVYLVNTDIRAGEGLRSGLVYGYGSDAISSSQECVT
jgi:hypothetical protein